MENLLRFLSLQDPNLRWVLAGTLLLCACAGTVGVFWVLRRRALVGDAVAHALLPGVVVAYVLAGSKNPLALVTGAFIAGWLALRVVDFLNSRRLATSDVAVALVLSVGFGLGILLLTAAQRWRPGAISGLDKFLFGQAASLTLADVQVFGTVGALATAAVLLLKKELALISFDRDYARALGLPVARLEMVLTTVSVLAVVVGIQAVGVVLMAALLLTPTVAARAWTHRLGTLMALAAALAMTAGVVGAYVSYALPRMPTGPWVVAVLSTLALLSLLLAPRRGVLARALKRRAHLRRTADENLLKALYLKDDPDPYSPPYAHRPALRRLCRRGLACLTPEGPQLSETGRTLARAIIKRHRLWEVYLSRRLQLDPRLMHADAETLEHLITPELEAQLAEELGYPAADPQQKPIPYQA